MFVFLILFNDVLRNEHFFISLWLFLEYIIIGIITYLLVWTNIDESPCLVLPTAISRGQSMSQLLSH